MENVFLTGGAGGIGEAIKDVFLLAGYTVSAPRSSELDLANSESIKQFFLENKMNFDIFVHCAGVNHPKPFMNITDFDIQQTVTINSTAFLCIVQHLTPQMVMKKQGHILAISSLYGTIARKGRLPYVASKHALNGIVKTLACELAESNIIVNALSPGFVDTKLTRINNSVKRIAELEAKIPIKRMATPREIAKVALFLCSKDNTYITGQDIIVDGGFMAEGGQD